MISIASITVPDDRLRSLDMDWAEALAADIAERGLKHEIGVRPIDDGYELIYGLHRLKAHELLGRDSIRALVCDEDDRQARLSEIMENLMRNRLTALERARSLFEIDRIYKLAHPELKRGGDRGNQHTGGKPRQTDILSVRQDVLDKVGLTDRHMRRAIAIWKGLSPASRSAVRGTWLADHQAQLQQLAAIKARKQADVLAILFPAEDTAPAATTVADALELIKNGRLPGHLEKKFASINRQIAALDEHGLDQVFAAHEARLVTWLKARGRI